MFHTPIYSSTQTINYIFLLSLITWLLFSVYKPFFWDDVAGFLFDPVHSSGSCVYNNLRLACACLINSTMSVVLGKLIEAMDVMKLVVSFKILYQGFPINLKFELLIILAIMCLALLIKPFSSLSTL